MQIWTLFPTLTTVFWCLLSHLIKIIILSIAAFESPIRLSKTIVSIFNCIDKFYTFANMKNWKYLLEPKLFGVCTHLAEKFHLPLSLVRLFFIYISFVGLLSPILFYLAFAYFLRFKEQFFQKRYQGIREL